MPEGPTKTGPAPIRDAVRLLADAPAGLLWLDPRGGLVWANDQARSLLIPTQAELTAESFQASCADEHPAEMAAMLADANAVAPEVAPPVRFECRHTGRTIQAVARRVETDAGEPGYLVSVTDVSLSPGTETTSTATDQQRLAAHFRRTPLASIEWNLDRTARLWNPAAERIFGFTAEEAATNDLFPLIVPPEARQMVDEVWESLLTASGGEASTNANVTKDGNRILCRWYNTPLLDSNGRVIAVASMAEDITARAHAETRVRESERRLATMIDRLPVIIWALDSELTPAFWNAHAQRITGYSADRILRNPNATATIFPADTRNLPVLVERDFVRLERPLHCADGHTRRILWSNVAERCPVPGWRAWGIGVDVTEQRTAERALQESERRFREVFQSVGLAAVIIGPDATVLDCNATMLDCLERSRDAVVGRDWFEITLPPTERAAARKELDLAMSEGVFEITRERRIISSSGAAHDINWTRSLLRDPDGRPVAACAFGLDVTQQRRTEAELADYRQHLESLVEQRTEALAETHRQLANAERLAAVGQLAAGVAHDINNILLPVRCHLDPLTTDANEHTAAHASAILSGLTVLEQLANSLRLLKGDSTAPCPSSAAAIHTDAWWQEVGPLIERTAPERVRFRTDIVPDLAPICGEPHQLTQAVVNLVINAAEAIAESATDATITLSIRDNRTGVVISVTDTGAGMAPNTRDRALEPFFSTKTRAMSTGLGLSIVHAFVRDAGGDLQIDSEPGTGTTVSLHVPYAPVIKGPERPPRTVIVQIGHPRIRSIHEQVLESLGWRCLSTPPDTTQPSTDLLVTDIPGATAAEGVPVVRVVSDSDFSRNGTVPLDASFSELREIYSTLVPA
jgi:PAS domain S-box-containing protein